MALAMDEDVLELRKAVEPLVERAMEIAPVVHEPSRLLKDGDNERSLGSFQKGRVSLQVCPDLGHQNM